MPTTHEITTCDLPRQETAVMRATMPVADVSNWLPSVYRCVAGYLERAGVNAAGPPFARYRFLDHRVAVEAGFPVDARVPGDGAVESAFLPAGPAVVTTHFGKYEELGDAYQSTRQWLRQHGHAPTGPHWEVYFTDPTAEPDPGRWRTELVVLYTPSATA